MSKKLPDSKWTNIYNKSEDSEIDNPNNPVDTPEEVKRRILNTEMGVPDTPEEVDAQRNNLGPKNTEIEIEDLENDEQPVGPKPGS